MQTTCFHLAHLLHRRQTRRGECRGCRKHIVIIPRSESFLSLVLIILDVPQFGPLMRIDCVCAASKRPTWNGMSMVVKSNNPAMCVGRCRTLYFTVISVPKLFFCAHADLASCHCSTSAVFRSICSGSGDPGLGDNGLLRETRLNFFFPAFFQNC